MPQSWGSPRRPSESLPSKKLSIKVSSELIEVFLFLACSQDGEPVPPGRRLQSRLKLPLAADREDVEATPAVA